MKKILAFFMALVILIGCVKSGTLEVSATEADAPISTNPYTFSVQNWTFPDNPTSDNPGTGYCMWLGLVTSPFWVEVATMSNGGGSNEVLLFDLEDEKNGHTIEAFCIDVDTAIAYPAEYRFYKRINLEDSSYFEDTNAQKIRAIVNHGVTVKSLADMQAAANEWLSVNGKAQVVNLTGAEALSATQYAIWCTANAKNLTSSDPYKSYYVQEYRFVRASANSHLYKSPCIGEDGYATTYKTGSGNAITYNQEIQYSDVSGNDAQINISEQNITGVADYLLSLAPEPPKEVALSDNTIQNPVVTYVLEADGTYTATVSFELTATVVNDTSMTATVSSGEKRASQEIKAAGVQTVTLPGLTAKTGIDIEINGEQRANDVFFFESIGGRSASQTLVGIDGCLVPVHAEATVTDSHMINITKTTEATENTVDGAYPLEGIEFDIYYWCSMEEYDANAQQYGAIDWSQENILDTYVTADDYVATLRTDVNGKAACNVSAWGDGVYLVAEKNHPAIKSTLAPFPVSVPVTAADGSGLVYEANLELKNEVFPGPKVRKDVTEIGRDLDSFGVGERHTWIIGADVPSDIANGKSYVITDTLDHRLTYAGDDEVNVKVALKGSNAGTENITLEKVTDYAINSTTDTITSFEVALTEAGMAKVAAAIASDKTYENYEVRVYFNAYIDEDAVLGVQIPNRAQLNYTNSVGIGFGAVSDEPKVFACGINIYKYDAANKQTPLKDATFKLARLATEDEINTGASAPLVVDNTTLNVVYETFYTKANLTAEEITSGKVQTVSTDGSGNAVIYGVGAGEYYLVEIQAPTGYNLPDSPIVVTLSDTTTSVSLEVANSSQFELPPTGGIGTKIFTICGIALIAVAVVVLIIKKKKDDEDEEEEEIEE
ncbi:MAG: isopeptide-forming domain-containing fimbrial protein [Lachnospiraceae bacterium]|nr:isopeptide-forming domain-containing fimbrial protein [Lachnospiraceae bacterium]